MESYGLLLKKAREAKNIDIDRAARETSISQQYITALEEEDEKVFPGEPYLYGFLKNYADYLGVNSDTACILYKNKKIQEGDVPMNLLIEKHRYIPVKFICLLVFLVLLLSGGVFAFLRFWKPAKDEEQLVLSAPAQVQQYRISGSSFTKRLYKGDTVVVPTKEGDVILTVAGTLNTFRIDSPSGRHQIELAEEISIALDSRMEEELLIYVSDVSARDESRGAEVSMFLKNDSSGETGEIARTVSAEIEELKVEKGQKVLISDTRAYPFTINATFRGACMFRSVVDSGDFNEAYYTSGEIVNMTSKNGVRIWISNGNAVRLQMIANGQTTSLDMVSGGQVLVQDIKWIKDTDGLYKVVIIDVD